MHQPWQSFAGRCVFVLAQADSGFGISAQSIIIHELGRMQRCGDRWLPRYAGCKEISVRVVRHGVAVVWAS
jgi:hypothetical protein